MLAKLTPYPSIISLIQNSNIQFLDFGITPDDGPRQGRFVRKTANGPLLRLQYDPEQEKYVLPAANGTAPEIVEPEWTIALSHSLKILNGEWVPLPFLRNNLSGNDVRGPDNWARGQIIRLDEPDEMGNLFRVVIALDTSITSDATLKSLAPCTDDITNGTLFSLVWRDEDVADFLDQTWVDGWLREVFMKFATTQGDLIEADIEQALRKFEYQAHWLALLELLGTQLRVPGIRMVTTSVRHATTPVDVVLDVGNSHTCGVLIEDHPGEANGLRPTTELQLRSLSHPAQVNAALLTSRLEFSRAQFGKQHFSVESGRKDAFNWPSIVRIGEEAQMLAMQRMGTEGVTGISSPRRYLWDETAYEEGWRFSQKSLRHSEEPAAIAMPMMTLMNDEGQPLYQLPTHEQLPVFSAQYSRSSLMMHMLCELLSHIISQINSFSHRTKMGQNLSPRWLRTLILTLPTAMPKQEREIFRQRVQEALVLVWKAMGWHQPGSADSIPMPAIQIDWDEASCGQIFWLYNEMQVNFSGQAETLFSSLRRPDLAPEERLDSLRVASIDIGGGTSDMVVNHYRLDKSDGHQRIVPQLLFREGFKIAGDDILLNIIQLSVLPAIQHHFTQAGISDPASLMNTLFGDSDRPDTRNTLRQQTTLQLLIPLGNAILQAWEESDPADPLAGMSASFASLLPVLPGQNVMNYVQQAVQRLCPANASAFELLQTTLQVNFSTLRQAVADGKFTITAPLHALCEAISGYQCDILLLTGRPTNIPGIQSLLRYLQPVPVTCMVALGNYPVHEWYPFSENGHRSQPKSTAAVGAMLLNLAHYSRLPGFYLQTTDIHAYSTIRYLGVLDKENRLRDSHVWYRDIDLDNPQPFPDSRLSFPLRDNVRLGFRQLDNERWPATPLYTLSIVDMSLKQQLNTEGELRVSLKIKAAEQNNSADVFELAEAKFKNGTPVPLTLLSLQLNTLTDPGGNAHQYWIDSGSVYKK